MTKELAFDPISGLAATLDIQDNGNGLVWVGHRGRYSDSSASKGWRFRAVPGWFIKRSVDDAVVLAMRYFDQRVAEAHFAANTMEAIAGRFGRLDATVQSPRSLVLTEAAKLVVDCFDAQDKSNGTLGVYKAAGYVVSWDTAERLRRAVQFELYHREERTDD